jgi:hypothetical protein
VVDRHFTPVALGLALVASTVNATLNVLAPLGRVMPRGVKPVLATKGKSASVTVWTATSRLLTTANMVAENLMVGSYAGTQKPLTFLARPGGHGTAGGVVKGHTAQRGGV